MGEGLQTAMRAAIEAERRSLEVLGQLKTHMERMNVLTEGFANDAKVVRRQAEIIARKTPETFRSAEHAMRQESQRLAQTISLQQWLLRLATALLILTTVFAWNNDRFQDSLSQKLQVLQQQQETLLAACQR